jgi:hypothetical protein
VLIPLAIFFFGLTAIYLAIQTRPVQDFAARKLTNYLSEQFGTTIHVGGLDVALFKRIVLKDVWIENQQADTLVYSRRVSATIDTLNFRKKILSLSRISFDQTKAYFEKDSTGILNHQFLVIDNKPILQPERRWTISCNRFILRSSYFTYQSDQQPIRQFQIDEVRLRIDNFRRDKDSLSFQLFSMSLNDGRGFYLNEFSAHFKQVGKDIFITNLRLETLNSEVNNADIAIRQQLMPGTEETVTDLEIDLYHSRLSLADISLFIPQLEGMEQQLELSGRVTGNMQNLRARNLNIKTGNNTHILADFSLSYMTGFSEPFLFVDLKQSQTDFRDISKIRLPNSSNVNFLSFPQQLYQAGIISYQGNFTGFFSDFVAYGTLNSRMGRIKTDISIVPDAANMLQYRGRLETASFNIGRLLQSPQFGQISFNGMVNGTYDRLKETIDGKFDGKISRWLLNNYNYQDITLNGQLSNKKFDGNIVVDDPNLKLNFSGELNLNEEVPVFDFLLHLQEADLVALNLDSVNLVSIIRFDMAANFSGNKMDNLDGLIQVFGAKYINQNDSLTLENLIISAHLDEIQSKINIESDYADISIVGTYDFSSIIESFRSVLANYLPALGRPLITNELKNQFELDLRVKEMDEISAVFLPGLHVKTPFGVKGEINTQKGTLRLEGEISDITWNDFNVKNIDINIQPDPDELTSKFRIEQFNYKDEITLHNLALMVDAGQNEMNTRIVWNNLDKITYSGDIETSILFTRELGKLRPLIDIDVLPSRIIIADSIWNLSPAKVTIDSTSIFINNFLFGNNNHFVAVNGKMSEDRNDQLSLKLQDIDLGNLDLYLQETTGLKGVVNGSLGIFDFYRSRLFYSDISVEGLEYQNHAIGDISIINKWDRETSLIDTEVTINQNNRSQFTGRGFFNPYSKNFIFNLNFNHFSLGVLNTLIKDGLTNFHGDGSGKVILSGTPDKLLIDGAIFAENAGLTIDYTQVSYRLNDSIRFSNDSLIFRRIEVRDVQNNRGIFNGSIRHDNFSNMDYNLALTTNQILALNTTSLTNDNFYGSAVARGSLRITGKGQNVRLAGEATSLAGTNITIVLGEDDEVTKYDFVRFITRDTISNQTQSTFIKNETGGIEIDLTVNVTPEARAQMIYNTQITDIIRAQGEGVIRFRMDRNYNINLSGNFNVTQGEYLFTLQNVINKRFVIEPGGSMVWSGDPYNAIIDLSAVYRLKASLRELLMWSQSVDYTQRIPVECKILLTNELISPTINFDIVFPTVEDRLRNEVQQYFATQEDLNKQMLSLLVLGQFYTPEFMRGSYEANNPNLIGNTASDLFSNQLSNWLSQINRDIDIGFNYRPGNQLTNDEIELALSTQIFNDRVIINGNIGNNTNPNSINNNELVGDFDIIVKLTPNGKLQLKAYNRANNNLIYETAPYTQGIGISFKEEYNTFDELWRKFIAIFRRDRIRLSPESAEAIPITNTSL